jgi:copper oxidase (laccase) domain-containing protein
MQNQYGSLPQDILVALGPSIGRCCYEIDATTADAFRQQKNNESFLFAGRVKNKWMLDLPEANLRQVLECGIPQENIESSGYCTVCRQDIFFSHRGAGGITGRQINFMMIKGDPPCRIITLNQGSIRIQ